MASQLPSGRWRPRVTHPHSRLQINAADVIGGPRTYATEKMAIAAENEATKILEGNSAAGVTVAEWWHTWTTDQRWLRPSESSNLHYRERTAKFVAAHADLPMRVIGDEHVAAWLKDGTNDSTVRVLRTFFSDAMSVLAGRLVERNPFAKLGLKTSSGRRDIQPPSQAEMLHLLTLADELTPPSFAALLHLGAYEGMRPGELDGLRWSKVNFQAGTILVDEQWVAKTHKFDLPKHRKTREIALTDPARERLLTLPQESEFVFTTLRGTHYTPSSRSHHWNRARSAAGLANVDLYTVTRHFFGWYAWNVLELADRDIALHLGHRDGGKLVRELYGHADEKLAQGRIRDAFASAPSQPARRLHVVS